MASIVPPREPKQDEEPDLPYQLPEKNYAVDISNLPRRSKASLPLGFPSEVRSSITWSSADIKSDEEDWIIELAPHEAGAIEEAVEDFRASKLPMQEIGPTTFPLPDHLTKKLGQISDKCHNGLGFCVLRGIHPRKRSEEEMAVLFGGVSAHVASLRGFQDINRTNVLAHLLKSYPREHGEYIPPSFNTAPVAFHTDDGDIVALYYASVAEQGGRTQLASQSTVYNVLAETRPDLLQVLAEEWLIDTYYAPPETAIRRLPLLHRHGDNGITIQYSRLPFSCYVGSRPRHPALLPLTELQKEALDALQILSRKHAFAVPTESGDILYFNNVGLFHAREKYVDNGTDDTAPEDMDRHVLRLWLQDPKRTIPLSAPLQIIWDDIYGNNMADAREETWAVKAVAAFAMNASKNG